jgi:hypothetical protein
MVVTGQRDQLFCNPTATSLTPADCGGPNGILAQTASLYPAASNYTFAEMPNMGHCWQLHRRAVEGFEKVHDWLEVLVSKDVLP